MEETSYTLLEKISLALEHLLLGEIPDILDCPQNADDSVKETCESVNKLIKAYSDASRFLLALSEGKLDVDVPPRNFLISPFKQLHANLRHLTWQTQQITKGDLNQHVDFLGEFSNSFNTMIASLREKRALEEELKRANELLEQQATTDPLTGIPNRLKFNISMANEISRSNRHSLPLSFIIFDIDYFKKINDTYGHHVGDLVLKEVAQLISDNLRHEDIFARWGGEEFVIVMPNTAIDGCMALAERLRLKIEQNSFSEVKSITCSFGVSQLRSKEGPDSFTKRADEALYRAKEGGRNRVEKEKGEGWLHGT